MYLTPSGKQIGDNDPYTSEVDGVRYCGNANKAEISELLPLTLTTPTFDPAAQTVVEAPPIQINGVWTQQWTVTNRPQEEIDAALAAAKVAKNNQINTWRAVANSSTFPFQSKTIACDSLSRLDIDGVANGIALTGAYPVGFPGAWKAVDNSYIVMTTIDDFKAFYSAMTMQGAINFSKAQALKAALASATTMEQINAIVWS